ncbi:hypothetical protein [Loigolactobacillus bifermentans]|uniref:Uncharacterized protein n=1 Tax=Loigolactobacillus bifermentans DSM 20003 TaxID=1423726 RepID=A0A0R1GRH2_9LACO|nr:hypothetical protein [Loigolactobacillus bifermentans]KRK35027.1 hypothetical protein FC07_GL000265 [Loigolactobacillus bifermentans DSM 20003]QGG60659.1 hypothetical protein LB003_09390 [Loigolactobacillus bifermentans]
MKTALTLDLEKTLYAYWEEQGATAVEEVTMPEDKGIVDTLVRESNGDTHTWRCFELKVTKADFHSAAKLSFIGNYNYFVLPARLYPKLKPEIPKPIGVLTYRAFDPQAIAASTVPVTTPGTLTIAKAAQYQALQVNEAALNNRFIASLNREVQKAKRVAHGLAPFSNEQLLKELHRRSDHYAVYDPATNLYDQFADQLQNDTIAALQAEVDALTAELAAFKLGAGQ